MEMMVMVLLVSAAAKSVSPASMEQNAHLTLNQIINLVAEIQKNVTQEFFVEDVKTLADKGCKEECCLLITHGKHAGQWALRTRIDFFCKVESVLREHGKDENLVRNLGIYIQHFNCTKELEKVPKSEVRKPITDLLHHLDRCSKKTNFNGGLKKSSSE